MFLDTDDDSLQLLKGEVRGSESLLKGLLHFSY